MPWPQQQAPEVVLTFTGLPHPLVLKLVAYQLVAGGVEGFPALT